MKSTGFSTIEALAATTILMVGVAALAQLVVLATARAASARAGTTTLLLAEQKMEQLRSGSAPVQVSPPGSLGADSPGWVDYLDATGRAIAAGADAPRANAAYIRRWAVAPVPGTSGGTVVLQVLVTRWKNRGAADAPPALTRLPDEARLVSALAPGVGP
jgi:type II secretory pathway pseudopilin PulG